MKALLAILLVVGLIGAASVLSRVRHPWLAEQAALQIGCPLLGPNSPNDFAMQCALYSRFGVVWDDMSNASSGTCAPGSHLETSRLEGAVCIKDGHHSIGGNRTCPDGYHKDGERCTQDTCAADSRPATHGGCCKVGTHEDPTDFSKCTPDGFHSVGDYYCRDGWHAEKTVPHGCAPAGFHAAEDGVHTCRDGYHWVGGDKCSPDVAPPTATPRAQTDPTQCTERQHWDGAKCTVF
jgi:hypothetical protein